MSGLVDWMAAGMQSLPVPDGIRHLTHEILRRHGDAVHAVLFYGSCRRSGDAADGLADLLVIVDRYRAVHGAGLAALANRLLPPNVYYLEVEVDDTRFRSKYAMVSLASFERRCRRSLDGYFWARFAQPAQIAYAKPGCIFRLAQARADAARRFSARAAGLMSGEMDGLRFWEQSLQASYRCELRPERPQAARRLIAADADYYQSLADQLLPEIPFVVATAGSCFHFRPTGLRRTFARLEWTLRRGWGKTLNIARLFKAAGTFTGGIDYLVWKVERHSGVQVEITDFMRRHPRLAAIGLARRLRRQGGFR